MSTNTDRPPTAINEYLTEALAQFRASLEEGTGQPIDALPTNPALLLSDLCRFLGLDEQQHDRVLGASGTRHLLQVLATRVSVPAALPHMLHESAPVAVESVFAPVPVGGSQ